MVNLGPADGLQQTIARCDLAMLEPDRSVNSEPGVRAYRDAALPWPRGSPGDAKHRWYANAALLHNARVRTGERHRMLALGIETTCDETAAAVVERHSDGDGRILSNIVHSQTADHARFGGVVPEIAARAHVDLLDGLVVRAMSVAGVGFTQLSGVAAAAGPGLIGGVIVGLTTAKAIALVHDTPLIAVNHLEAHALTPRLTSALEFPYCLFLASGGHTQIVAVLGVGDYVRLGTTVDDAMGEAFDKVAKMLACPIRADRKSSAPRRTAMPRGSSFRGRCSAAPTPIFRCPA